MDQENNFSSSKDNTPDSPNNVSQDATITKENGNQVSSENSSNSDSLDSSRNPVIPSSNNSNPYSEINTNKKVSNSFLVREKELLKKYAIPFLEDAIYHLSHSVNFISPVIELWPSCKESYLKRIAKPMDLRLILSNLNKNKYKDINSLYDDIALIWENCFEYNESNSDIYYSAKVFKASIKKRFINQVYVHLYPNKDNIKLNKKLEIKENKKYTAPVKQNGRKKELNESERLNAENNFTKNENYSETKIINRKRLRSSKNYEENDDEKIGENSDENFYGNEFNIGKNINKVKKFKKGNENKNEYNNYNHGFNQKNAKTEGNNIIEGNNKRDVIGKNETKTHGLISSRRNDFSNETQKIRTHNQKNLNSMNIENGKVNIYNSITNSSSINNKTNAFYGQNAKNNIKAKMEKHEVNQTIAIDEEEQDDVLMKNNINNTKENSKITPENKHENINSKTNYSKCAGNSTSSNSNNTQNIPKNQRIMSNSSAFLNINSASGFNPMPVQPKINPQPSIKSQVPSNQPSSSQQIKSTTATPIPNNPSSPNTNTNTNTNNNNNNNNTNSNNASNINSSSPPFPFPNQPNIDAIIKYIKDTELNTQFDTIILSTLKDKYENASKLSSDTNNIRRIRNILAEDNDQNDPHYIFCDLSEKDYGIAINKSYKSFDEIKYDFMTYMDKLPDKYIPYFIHDLEYFIGNHIVTENDGEGIDILVDSLNVMELVQSLRVTKYYLMLLKNEIYNKNKNNNNNSNNTNNNSNNNSSNNNDIIIGYFDYIKMNGIDDITRGDIDKDEYDEILIEDADLMKQLNIKLPKCMEEKIKEISDEKLKKIRENINKKYRNIKVNMDNKDNNSDNVKIKNEDKEENNKELTKELEKTRNKCACLEDKLNKIIEMFTNDRKDCNKFDEQIETNKGNKEEKIAKNNEDNKKGDSLKGENEESIDININKGNKDNGENKN